MLKLLAQRGLKLYFLPPYSPELNRIEKLWHKMKYTWMAFKAYPYTQLILHKLLAYVGRP